MSAKSQSQSNNLNTLRNCIHSGILLRRHVPWLRLDLFKSALTTSTAHPSRINALRVPSIIQSTSGTVPHVLVLNRIGMPSRDMYLVAVQRVVAHGFSAFLPPALEAWPMWVIVDLGDQVVGQVAVFVGDGVDDAVFAVDDALGELDLAVVSGHDHSHGAAILTPDGGGFALPGGSAGGFEEGFGPDDLDAAGKRCQLQNLAPRNCMIEGLEEVSRILVLALIE